MGMRWLRIQTTVKSQIWPGNLESPVNDFFSLKAALNSSLGPAPFFPLF
jgi:hypothetical protein